MQHIGQIPDSLPLAVPTPSLKRSQTGGGIRLASPCRFCGLLPGASQQRVEWIVGEQWRPTHRGSPWLRCMPVPRNPAATSSETALPGTSRGDGPGRTRTRVVDRPLRIELEGRAQSSAELAEPATNKQDVTLTLIGDSDDGGVVTSLGNLPKQIHCGPCRIELRAIGIEG